MNTEQEKKLNEIYNAIVGNEKMKIKGLAQKVEDLEKYKAKDQKLKYKVAGGVAVGTPGLVVFWDWIKSHLF